MRNLATIILLGFAALAILGMVTLTAPQMRREALKAVAPVSWQTLDDEMDLCRSVAELEAWNERRKAEIKALPEAKYNVLADKFGDLRSKLPDVTPEPAKQADAYAIADDEIPH